MSCRKKRLRGRQECRRCKPKKIKVKINKRVLTYHIYGKRPKRGQMVRARAGLYDGALGEVVARHSWRYRGYTYLAQVVKPREWEL